MQKRKVVTRRARSGVALVTTICFAAVVTAIVTLVLRLSVTHLRLAHTQADIEKAHYAAEAGLQLGAFRLGQRGTKPPLSFDGKVGDATHCVVIIDGATPAEGWHSVGGQIGVNPNNSPHAEFTLTRPTGSLITLDDLTETFPGYTGPATRVRIKPHGHGSQSGLLVDGLPYPIENATTYTFDSSVMTVHLYNDHVTQGKAKGKWWIAIATTQAQITSE